MAVVVGFTAAVDSMVAEDLAGVDSTEAEVVAATARKSYSSIARPVGKA
jgi:hypothetical protein